MNDTQLGLLAARTLISKKSDWTFGAFARNKNGSGIRSDEVGAVRWCAIGALTGAGLPDGVRRDALSALSAFAGDASISEINDDGGHVAALTMFDRAIELAA